MATNEIEKYRHLLRDAPAVIVVLSGKEGQIELVSDAVNNLLPGDEVVGRTMREAWPEFFGQGHLELIEQVFETGVPVQVDESLVMIDVHRSGQPEPLWFKLDLRPYRDTAGAVLGVMVFAVDMTESVRNRLDLEESRARLEFAQVAGGIGVFEWVIGTAEVLWDSEVEVQFGIPRGSFEGTYEAWAKRVHPDDLQMAQNWVRRAVEQNVAMNMELRIIRPDGTLRWQLARAKVLPGADGRPAKFIGMTIDITERKLREPRHKEANDRITRILEGVLETT
jgi:PAS domain S-box-containing protein